MTAAKSLTQSQPTFLRRVLYADHTVSGLAGLAMLIAPGPIARFLGWSQPLVVAEIGVALVLYSALLFFTARQAVPDRRLVWAAIGLNGAWVLASVVLVVTPWVPLTSAGQWAVLIVADGVAVFAVLEFWGLQRK
jgi:hypothetical protein